MKSLIMLLLLLRALASPACHVTVPPVVHSALSNYWCYNESLTVILDDEGRALLVFEFSENTTGPLRALALSHLAALALSANDTSLVLISSEKEVSPAVLPRTWYLQPVVPYLGANSVLCMIRSDDEEVARALMEELSRRLSLEPCGFARGGDTWICFMSAPSAQAVSEALLSCIPDLGLKELLHRVRADVRWVVLALRSQWHLTKGGVVSFVEVSLAVCMVIRLSNLQWLHVGRLFDVSRVPLCPLANASTLVVVVPGLSAAHPSEGARLVNVTVTVRVGRIPVSVTVGLAYILDLTKVRSADIWVSWNNTVTRSVLEALRPQAFPVLSTRVTISRCEDKIAGEFRMRNEGTAEALNVTVLIPIDWEKQFKYVSSVGLRHVKGNINGLATRLDLLDAGEEYTARFRLRGRGKTLAPALVYFSSRSACPAMMLLSLTRIWGVPLRNVPRCYVGVALSSRVVVVINEIRSTYVLVLIWGVVISLGLALGLLLRRR